ncbi:MAG: peptidylprolyl isomerase [Chromatiales bacterium]|nr:peptidylprolyl isomerase [Chromatiales bacterium]
MHRLPSFRRFWHARVIAVAMAGLCASGAAAPATAGVELDRVVAVVNDDIISASELDVRLGRVRVQLRQSGTAPPPPDALRRQVLERLILRRLQLQIARNSGMRVDDESLNRTILRIAEQNELTLREFRDAVERDGHDFARFREEIREDILIAEVRRRRVENQIIISQGDIDDYISMMESRGAEADRHRYRIGHILIAVPDGASSEEIDEARERAERVLEELRAGADFASMAVTHSDGQKALEGGDLGWRLASDLPTMLADAVLRLETGDVSEPVRSASGFHLVKLVDRQGSQRQMIRQTLARHILITLDALTDNAEARRQLGVLRERIVNGEDFGELARIHSDDPGSASRGGELGWIDPGNTVPVFERTMDSLAPGAISEPFRSQFGWHLVQVLERRDLDATETSRRAEARRRLRSRKIEENTQAWLRRVRGEAYVEYRLGE